MVKNVRPGALAGNLTPLDPADAVVSQDDPPEDVANPLPDGDLDSRIQWVTEAEDLDEAVERADLVWSAYENDDTIDHGQLSGRLRVAVHGEPDPSGGQDSPAPVEGVVVDSDTAGTAEAVNAETGEVTQPGDPLPPIEQDGGTPLEPATGDDSAPVAPESTDDPNGAENPDSGAEEPQNSTGSDDGGNSTT